MPELFLTHFGRSFRGTCQVIEITLINAALDKNDNFRKNQPEKGLKSIFS